MSENQSAPEVPEDSIPLRGVVFAMAVLCTVASSLFVRTAWWMAAIYLVLIVSGSFLSYKFREQDPRWLKYIWWIGILLVGVNAMYEFTGPLRDEFDFVSPFVHFLCGIFAFVTFSMRTRTDLHTATGLGLLLICLSAPVAKGLPYGCCVFAYLTLSALMMYFDCVSRTVSEWLARRITNAPEVPVFLNQKRVRRVPRGNTIALLTVVPLVALAMFLYVPRADEYLDKIWAYSKTMKLEYLTDMFYKAAMPPPPTGPKDAHAGREWFNKHENKQLPMTGKYASKLTPEEQKQKLKEAAEAKAAKAKKDEELRKEREKAEKDIQEQMAAKQQQAMDAKARDKAEATPPKPPKDKPKLTKDSDKNAHKAEANSNPVVKADDKKPPEPPKDEKPKERQAKTKAVVAAENAKAAADKDSKDKPKDAEPIPPVDLDTKDGAGGKDGKDGKGTEGGGEKNAKSKKKGKKGGGEGPEGKDGTGGNKEPSEDGKDGKGNDEGKGEVTIGSDNILRVADKEKLDERMVFTVKSRRLVYLRRQCFDFYTGTQWQRTPAKKKAPPVTKIRVIDGVVKKEEKKIQPRPVPKPVVRQQVPQQMIRGSQPSVFGNTAGSVVAGSQPSVFGNTNAAASKVEEPKVLRSESPQKVEPQKAAPTAANEEKSEADQEQLKESKFARPFVFESTERPIFKVGMADALKPESTLPTVELVQEIKVRAKSIGNVIPGGWIPQEVKLQKDQKKVDVDTYGVMTSPKPLNRDAEIKVKTDLPIYPIDAMRQELPLSAAEDEKIRDRFSQYLQLPDSTSDELFKVAETNSDPRYNWYMQSEQICNYLRENFEYDANREVEGKPKDLVDEFLFNRGVGNSNDFASTFVVLTRCIGIPSRLVSGFAPGDHNPVTGEQEVRMKHRLVWAEVYVPQFGWVPFDAHPGGVLPAQKREAQYTPQEVQKQLGLEKTPFAIKWGEVITFCVAALIALVVGFIAFKVLLALYRKWRKANAGRGPEWKQYKKVSKAIKNSMKLTRAPAETPTEFLARVQNVIDERKSAGKVSPEALPDALASFLKFYSAVYFGRQFSAMEHLKYHADQVCKVTKSVKMKDLTEAQATAKSAVRRKDEFKDGAASSAVRRKK